MSAQPSLLVKAEPDQVILPSNEAEVQVVRDRSAFSFGKYWAYFKDGTRELIGGPGAGFGINIYNSDGTLTSNRTLDMDGKFLIFTDGTGKSVDFLQRKLYMNDGLIPDHMVLNWQDQQLYRYPALGGFLSMDWSQSWLTDINGQVTVAWVDKILYSREPGDLQIASVQWATRELIDNVAFTTLNWKLRELYSTIGSLAANWELRRLYDSLSGDSSLDWEAQELHLVWNARDGFKIGTGDTITKVVTAVSNLDFPDTLPQTSSDLTIAVADAVDGDSVSLGIPSSSVLPDSSYIAFVSAPGVVTVRFNNYSAINQDPTSGDFRVTIMKF